MPEEITVMAREATVTGCRCPRLGGSRFILLAVVLAALAGVERQSLCDTKCNKLGGS